MNAPEKIFIPLTDNQDILINEWSAVPMSQDSGEAVVENVEYIRKDALLEWAEEQERQALEDLMNGLPLEGKLSAFRRIVEKIESL